MWGILEIVVSDLEEENKKQQGGFLPDMHSILTHAAEQNTTQHIWNIQAFSHTQSWHDRNLNEKHLDTHIVHFNSWNGLLCDHPKK